MSNRKILADLIAETNTHFQDKFWKCVYICKKWQNQGRQQEFQSEWAKNHNHFQIDIFSSETLKMLKYNSCHSIKFDH